MLPAATEPRNDLSTSLKKREQGHQWKSGEASGLLWVPKTPSKPSTRTFAWGRGLAMMGYGVVLPYVALVRLLQLFRLRRREQDELAVEVVVLRHELAVLRRHGV